MPFSELKRTGLSKSRTRFLAKLEIKVVVEKMNLGWGGVGNSGWREQEARDFLG